MSVNELKPGYIATLDGWRAIAVLLVIASHAIPILSGFHSPIANLVVRIASHTGFGVDIFFAISGFLICTLLVREKRRGSIDLLAFFKRRIFRILPIVFVYVGVVWSLSLLQVIPTKSDEIISVPLFYRNYLKNGGWYTGHFWSLAVEEHFYLVIPFVIAILSRRRAIYFAVAAALACIVIRYFEWRYMPYTKVEFRTEARFDAVMFGCILAMICEAPQSRAVLDRHLNGVTVLITMAMALYLLSAFHAMPLRRTVVAITIPVVLAYTILHPREFLGRLLEMNWLRWIGRLSFSLYVWQMLFLVPDVHVPLIQTFPGAFIGTAACALASYYLVEQPSILAGRRWMSRRRSAGAHLA